MAADDEFERFVPRQRSIVERKLKRGPDALVSDPAWAPPAALAVQAGRAVRRRRVGVTLAGVAVLAVVAIPVLHRSGPPAAVGEQPTATGQTYDPATDPARFPVVHESGGDGVQRGPRQATIGTPYPFDLYIHCGLRNADFAGRWWQADPVDLNYQPRMHYRDAAYVPGTMTLVAADEARFDASAEGLRVTYRPLAALGDPCG
jgi:hypothetical protein